MNIKKYLKKCIKKDKAIIDELDQLLADVNDHHTRCHTVKTGGTVAGVTGNGMFVGSLLMAPFTGGVSLVVGLGGAALSFAGGATSTVTDIVDSRKTKKIMSNIEDIVKSKTQFDQELKEQMESFNQVVGQLITLGVPHENAVNATLKAVANGTVDLKEAAQNKNILRSLTIASGLIHVENETLKSLPLIGKTVHLSEKNIRFIYSIFGITGTSTATALKTFGKITAVASIAFSVLDVTLLIKDWNKDHPTIEIITDVQGQLRKEVKRLQKLADILEKFTYKVGYIEILDHYPCVGASVDVVNLCHSLLAFDLVHCKRIMEKFGIEFLHESELDEKAKIISFFMYTGVAKGFTKSEITNTVSKVMERTGQRDSAEVRELYKAIKEKVSVDEKNVFAIEKSTRGEHVINDDVIDIYRDIISRFLQRRFRTYELGHVRNVGKNSAIYRDYQQSLSASTQNNIRTVMIAQIPTDYQYLNADAILYGFAVEILKKSCVEHMCELWDNYDNNAINFDTHNTSRIEIALELFMSENVFVDHKALAFWQRQHHDNRAVFDGAEYEVKNMLNELYDKLREWVSDLKRL